MRIFLTIIIILETVGLSLLGYREIERVFGNNNVTVNQYKQQVFLLDAKITEQSKLLDALRIENRTNNQGIAQALDRTVTLRDMITSLEERMPVLEPAPNE